jgi:hypothetical protein
MELGRLQIDFLAGHCMKQYERMLVKVSSEDLYGAVSQVHKNFEYIAVYRADMHFHVVAHALPLSPCGIWLLSFISQQIQAMQQVGNAIAKTVGSIFLVPPYHSRGK